MPSMFATCTPRRSTSSAGMTTTHEVGRPARDQGEVLLARRGGEQLRVGEPVEALGVAGPQHAGGDDERPGARPAARLVDARDRARARVGAAWSAASSCPPTGGRRHARAAAQRATAPGDGCDGRRAAVTSGAGAGTRLARAPACAATTSGSRPIMPSATGAPASPSASAGPWSAGRASGIEPIRANGSTMNRARPMTLEIGHGAVAGHPGVGRVVAAVAHHPQRARGHRDRPERVLPCRARVGQEVDVGLVERLAVDEHPVARVAALHGLAADGDDPLDEVLLVGRGEADRANRGPAVRARRRWWAPRR